MNCSNCGKPLLAGSTICPICGTDNANTQNNNTQDVANSSVNQVVSTDTLVDTNTPPSQTVNPNGSDLEKTQLLEPIKDLSNLNSTDTLDTNNQEESTLNAESSEMFDLSDNDSVVITENMAPPTLNVEEENLTQGAGDLSNEESISTYSEEAEALQKQEEIDEQNRQSERVDIAIPSVGEVTEVSMPSDGSAPEVTQGDTTVGENTSATTTLEDPNKKKKFKIVLPKGRKNVPKSLMIIIAVIFLVIGILLGKSLFSKNYCSTNTGNRSVLSNKKVKYISDGKNNTTNIGGFTYLIPSDYTYDKSNGGVLIYGEDDLFRIYIRTNDGLYQDLTGAKNSLRASMIENSITVNNVKELKANDVEFLVFETTTKLNNRMIAFADAGNDKVYYLEIVDANNGYDYDILDITADILKNAKYEEVSSNMEKIDINDVSDVSIKAALEYKNLMKR